MLIWRVAYDCVFTSSSGGQWYSVEHKNQTGLVWTTGETLSDVRTAITNGLDHQTALKTLVSAEYIGKTLNRLNA